MPPTNRFQKDRKTSQVLRDFDKKNNKRYEELYNTYLEIMRTKLLNCLMQIEKIL